MVILIAAPSWSPKLSFVPPFSILVAGRTEFALIGLIVPWLLLTPLPRLPRASTRKFVIALAAVVVVAYSILPFLSPALIREQLLSLKTQIDRDGICLQSTQYTCGPAAAVTALRRLGYTAQEGELAVIAHTSLF